MDNKQIIKQHVLDMLDQSHDQCIIRIDKILRSGCLDIDGYDPNNNPMLIPKAITMALLDFEKDQYSARCTSYEKQVKKEFKNIKYFL